MQFKQVISLKEKLDRKYALNVLCEKYETFIIGDFNVDFNNYNDSFDVREFWNIFEQSGLKIISSTETNFILHSNNENKDIYDRYTNTTYNIYDDKITTLFFKNENIVEKNTENVKYNVIFNDENFETKRKFYKVLSDLKYFYKSKNKMEENPNEKTEDINTKNDIIIEIKDNYFDKNLQKSPSPSNSSDDDWQTI
jgi:hypothetical protein